MADAPEGWEAGPAPDPTLKKVAGNESGNRNLPPTANYDYPRSHASSEYQFQPSTWREATKATGVGTRYPEAYQDPYKDERTVNAEWLKNKYGVNSSHAWAASAPPGGYKDTAAPEGWVAGPAGKQEAPAGWAAGPAPAKQGQPWRVPPAQEGPREKVNLSNATDLPQRPTGPMDPSIAARRPQPTPIGDAAGAEAQAMMSSPGADLVRKVADYAKARDYQLSDIMGGLIEKGFDATHDAIVGILKQPLPGIAPNFGMPDTQANQLARDMLTEFTRRQGDEIKSPAIQTAEGRVVEGPNHPAIEAAGTTGTPGFVTKNGKFLDRTQAGEVAKATRQAGPNTVDVGSAAKAPETPTVALHSEDLRVPQPAGADVVSKATMDAYTTVPPVPSKDYIQSTDDSGFRLRQTAVKDQAEMQQFLQQLPKELKDPKVQEAFYNFKEGDASALTPALQEQYDKYMVPLNKMEEDLYGEIKKTDPDIVQNYDPAYVHRMVKGKSREFDPWMIGEASDPVGGYKRTTTGSLKDRVYYAIESEKGTRKLVAITDKGTMILNKGQEPQPLSRYQGEATKPGDKFSINGERWSVKQAKTSEIEAETNISYYKNAMASTVKNIVQLRNVARSLAEIRRIKSTPEFQTYTVPIGKPKPQGWKTVDFGPFRDVWMQPHQADVLSDIWASKGPVSQRLAAINRVAVGSLFWSPIPHALNAAAHWTTARGWDWVTPQGARSLFTDLPRAVQQVVTQGPEYLNALKEGSGMVYGSIANDQFYRSILKTLGESVKREPWKWDPIARVMGVGPSDLVKMIYGTSSRALWATSDVFMMQRLYELQRKGMPIREAIKEAEKHLPNYRIPPQVLNSRMFAQLLKDPSLTVFSRYHYGMFKSYAHMARDLAVGTGPEKVKAMGNIFATALLGLLVWPAINRGIQRLTGDKDIELGPKGSLTIPMMVFDALDPWRNKPINQAIEQSITLAPLPKLGLEEYFNLNTFTGKNIREPGDQRQHQFGRLGAQTAEHVAQGMNAPYSVASQGMEKRGGGLRGVGESLVKEGLGLRKTPKAYGGRTGGGGTYADQANYRHAHPRGLIEAAEKRAEQWLKEKTQ